ncbi:MAG: transposase [Methylococcales bacterium]|nr:transposase [Methylococcales bacterium]
MSKLHNRLAQTWLNIQDWLFPWLAEELVTTLEMIRIEEFIHSSHGFPDRPPKDRGAIARAYIAKMVYNMPTTRTLLDRLKTGISLRRICGWERVSDIPEEWTFSRAFAEFSKSQLPERVHESFIKKHYKGEIVGHNSRDSTAIDAREKPLKKEKVKQAPKKRGQPKKGEARLKKTTRIEQQAAGSRQQVWVYPTCWMICRNPVM